MWLSTIFLIPLLKQVHKLLRGVPGNVTESSRRRHASRDENSILWQFWIPKKFSIWLAQICQNIEFWSRETCLFRMLLVASHGTSRINHSTLITLSLFGRSMYSIQFWNSNFVYHVWIVHEYNLQIDKYGCLVFSWGLNPSIG